MTSKHTPGPWTVNESPMYVRVVGSDGENLFHEHKQYPRVMEDARLIAAAPELLEALKDMVDSYEYEASYDNPVLIAAREAIAKATGDSDDH